MPKEENMVHSDCHFRCLPCGDNKNSVIPGGSSFRCVVGYVKNCCPHTFKVLKKLQRYRNRFILHCRLHCRESS